MKIDHIAVWVDDIEMMRQFYLNYFDVTCGERYVNNKKGFTSYFLSFEGGNSRIELMHRIDIKGERTERGFMGGLAHIAISLGSEKAVNELTERLRGDNYTIASEPRVSGDGYYESAVLDPEGNYIEIVK